MLLGIDAIWWLDDCRSTLLNACYPPYMLLYPKLLSPPLTLLSKFIMLGKLGWPMPNPPKNCSDIMKRKVKTQFIISRSKRKIKSILFIYFQLSSVQSNIFYSNLCYLLKFTCTKFWAPAWIDCWLRISMISQTVKYGNHSKYTECQFINSIQ